MTAEQTTRKTTRRITYEQIAALEPCGFHGSEDGENYTPKRIRELMGGREFVTPQEVRDHPDVSWDDKYWLFAKLLPEHNRHELACRVAETTLQHIKDEDLLSASKVLIQAKRDWMNGRIDGVELDATRGAYRTAYSIAYWAADRAARREADWATHRAADWAADRDAYMAADWATHRAADSAADRAAAYKEFCDIALEMVESEG